MKIDDADPPLLFRAFALEQLKKAAFATAYSIALIADDISERSLTELYHVRQITHNLKTPAQLS